MQISLDGTRAFITAGGAGMGRATALAMRAVGELKVMRGQLTEKDTVIGKAAERIKELLGTVEV